MYGSEMVATRLTRDVIVEMHIKLKMFGVPITGTANVYCDNKGVASNTSAPESTLSKKHNLINYNVICKSVAAEIMCVAKENTLKNLADVLTKLLHFCGRASSCTTFCMIVSDGQVCDVCCWMRTSDSGV
jgi:hypothetical protein